MYHDVTELRNFYYRTQLGRSTQRRIRDTIAEAWPDIRGEVLVGFGFAIPFVRPLQHNFDNLAVLMPAQQGVVHWPSGEANSSLLCQEYAWPLGAGSVDAMIVAHALENSESSASLLEEIWRVMTQNGQVIFVVPHRGGAWARNELTPFGFGRPYSGGQIERLLVNAGFEINKLLGALHAPPTRSRLGLKRTELIERFVGRNHNTLLSGALVVAARKSSGVIGGKIRKTEPVFTTPEFLAAPATPRM